MNGTAHFDTPFYRTLDSASRGTEHDPPVNIDGLLGDSRELAQSSERLFAYGQFLGKARKHVATSGHISRELEREVIQQARLARNDSKLVIRHALRILRQFKSSGLQIRIWNGIHAAVAEAGSVDANRLREDVLAYPGLADHLKQAGFSDQGAKNLIASFPEIDGTVSAEGDLLIYRTAAGLEGRLQRRAFGSGRPRTFTDLLFADSFDVAAARFEQTGVLIPSHVRLDSGTPDEAKDMFQIALALLETCQMQLNRHVRELEQLGLAKYEGRGAGLGLLLAIIFTIGIALLVLCGSTGNADCYRGVAIVLLLSFFGGWALDSAARSAGATTSYGNPE